MSDVVVTGATGHVGANLVRALLERGDHVRALVRQDAPDALDGLDVEPVRGDVRDIDSLRGALEGADLVYHAAAQISIVGSMNGKVEAINVHGARNVGLAAIDCGVRRMIHFCSVHAFEQQPLTEPIDETRARVSSGASAYDRSKARGEAAIRDLVERGLDVVILHPSGIVGPGDYKPSRMGQVLLDLVRRKLPGLVDGGFDWVDVRDVVDCAISAAEHGRTGHSYIVSGQWHSIAEVAAVAASITGVRPPRATSPMWLARLGAPFLEAWAKATGTEPLYTRESLLALRANPVYVADKARRELGHDPRPVETSIRDAYRWFAARGWIDGSIARRIDPAPS